VNYPVDILFTFIAIRTELALTMSMVLNSDVVLIGSRANFRRSFN
jgi:hypothetical protein